MKTLIIFKQPFKTLIFLLFLLFAVIPLFASEKGKITGKITDAVSGEPLVGANVYLKGTLLGASTDLKGYYEISSIAPGTYELVISMIQYEETRIPNLLVKSGQSIKFNYAVEPEILTSKEIVVEARAVQNTEAALLSKRQNTDFIGDAVSSEAITRSGFNNAASAMKMVTGASVVDGKYVYVRGLGERYSATQLNGAELPSADPDKKAFQMDLLPSNLLDNIETQKTFTPDKPGNFSGGIVNIATKSFPDKFNFNLAVSMEYNSNASFNPHFITQEGGSLDWLGMDDGTRALPKQIAGVSREKYNQVKDEAIVNNNLNAAKKLSDYSNQFNHEMAPITSNIPMNKQFSLSVGNNPSLFGERFGYQLSLSYLNKYQFYDGGRIGKYKLPGNINDYNQLINEFDLSETKGINSVDWGGLLNLSYELNNNSQIHTNFIYSKSGISNNRYISGFYNEGTIDDATFETRVLKYTERDLFTSQIRGEHLLHALNNVKIDWNASYAQTNQDEPDTRFFSDHYYTLANGTRRYMIKPAVYPVPTRYFRNLYEGNYILNLNIKTPIFHYKRNEATVKFGGAFSDKNRVFRERTYKYENNDQLSYDGIANNYFSQNNTGILYNEDGSIKYDDHGKIVFGNYIVDASEDRSNYDGHERIIAGYGMFDIPFMNNMRLIAGLRYELTNMNVLTLANGYDEGKIFEKDLLPSLNLLYKTTTMMNFRLAYGRTLARPTMREMAPFSSEDFAAGFIIAGNPDLQRTLIDNFDFRWEFFDRPGEIYAVSAFYKEFTHPIERVIRNDNNEIRYENVSNAIIIGTELELRKNLNQLSPFLRHIQLGVNFTAVYSKVDIPERELQSIRTSIPDAPDTRSLQGQSPYLVNINLLYTRPESGSSLDIYYNVFGKRLSEVTLGPTPNIYEKSRHTLNISFNQKIIDKLKFKINACNIFNSKYEKVYYFKGKEYAYQRFLLGRNISIGLSYSID